MSRYLLAAAMTAALAFSTLAASDVSARGAAYYGTDRGQSARSYSGAYGGGFRGTVPTFTLPYYSGYNTYYRGGYNPYYNGYSPYGCRYRYR